MTFNEDLELKNNIVEKQKEIEDKTDEQLNVSNGNYKLINKYKRKKINFHKF